uniref:Leucine-rich repeat-containing N-terminal plant-type domain-containing protein n=1 Tax=Populus alba TaxID=43335 RepID=A0A4U5Q8K2_POPAL|nr:hypothetical protein D5086_0000140940 [Populus alba]
MEKLGGVGLLLSRPSKTALLRLLLAAALCSQRKMTGGWPAEGRLAGRSADRVSGSGFETGEETFGTAVGERDEDGEPCGSNVGLQWWGSLALCNCCEWREIECDPTTRRVIQLSLNGGRDYNLGDWVLNASLFQPFKELQSLELGYNGLVGCMENEGFEVLSSKLRELNLGDNGFNNDKSILSCFNGNLSTLKSLDLSYIWLTAGSGGSFYGLKVLSSRLKKLENLHLRSNQYNDSIFPSLTGFSSLKSLDLSGNQLTGSGFEIISSHLGKLENLDLSYNIFNDNIFSHLRGLSPLKSLNLSGNMLLGSTTVNGKVVKSLDFSGNLFKDAGILAVIANIPEDPFSQGY